MPISQDVEEATARALNAVLNTVNPNYQKIAEEYGAPYELLIAVMVEFSKRFSSDPLEYGLSVKEQSSVNEQPSNNEQSSASASKKRSYSNFSLDTGQ